MFQALEMPADLAGPGSRFTAVPIPGHEQHRIGKDAHGAPALLISVTDTPRNPWSVPIALEHLAILRNVECHVALPDGAVEMRQFTIVLCLHGDHSLHGYFLQVVAAIVTLLGPIPSSADVNHAISRLVELFRALTSAPKKSVQGLWAELFLMARLREPSALVAAWHSQPSDLYDFSAGSQRIEVKSATGRVRRHHFTLEQVLPIPGTRVLVASVLIERAGAGTSVAELIDQVRSRVSNNAELLLRIDQVVSLTLGNSWRAALEERFDRQLAEDSISFFEPTAIPKPSADLPAGVSNVRFQSDLSGAPTVDTREYRALGGLFKTTLDR